MRRPASMAFVAALSLAGSLVACAHQPAPAAYDPPGFLLALVHGAVAPIALVAGLVSDARIYAFPNSGLWYDFGFLIGLGSIWGGGSTYIGRS